MLKPLQQWICDTCGEVIASADAGWLEWVGEKKSEHSFLIVHHAAHSPLTGSREGCYQHGASRHRKDDHLTGFVGANGLQRLLSFLDVGPLVDPDREYGGRSVNIPEYFEIVRRLHLPYYEQARLYFDIARSDGYYEGDNASPYNEEYLKTMIKKYIDKE